jgi:uncharacterized protein YhfF
LTDQWTNTSGGVTFLVEKKEKAACAVRMDQVHMMEYIHSRLASHITRGERVIMTDHEPFLPV